MYSEWTGNLLTAKRYFDGGLNVIPVLCDGTKRPAIAWSRYIEQRFPWYIAGHYWSSLGRPNGIAIVCGQTSGGLEVIDFDDPSMFDRWAPNVPADLLASLPVVATPRGGGRHVYLRCSVFAGNVKLAMGECGEKTLIETRGQGGYVLAPGTPPWAHPKHAPYSLLQGDLCNVPTISPDDREALFSAARALNRHTKSFVAATPRAATEKAPKAPTCRREAGEPRTDRPGDDFNQRATWNEVLEPHGWTLLRERAGVGYWRKPGSDGDEHHATTNHGGDDRLFIFSTNIPGFDAGTGFSKFGAYAHIEHGGNFSKAAAALVSDGYGAGIMARYTLPPEQEEFYGFN